MAIQSPLVDTSWLQDHLNDPDVAIFDASVFVSYGPDNSGPPVAESGRAAYEEAHIPGAHFVDLGTEFSDPDAATSFTMIPAAEFCEKMAAYGVSDESTVVVYSASTMMWATRLWWMFRSVGFDNCYVLDGGFGKWVAEGRPTSSAPPEAPISKGKLTCRPRPELWSTKQEVMEAIGSATCCTISALPPPVYSGESKNFARNGHIPGSINVFCNGLMDMETNTFLPENDLRRAMAPSGALEKDRVICYCGGGISATIDALALQVLGHGNVAVYDGSMSDWVRDEKTPLSKGMPPKATSHVIEQDHLVVNRSDHDLPACGSEQQRIGCSEFLEQFVALAQPPPESGSHRYIRPDKFDVAQVERRAREAAVPQLVKG